MYALPMLKLQGEEHLNDSVWLSVFTVGISYPHIWGLFKNGWQSMPSTASREDGGVQDAETRAGMWSCVRASQ